MYRLLPFIVIFLIHILSFSQDEHIEYKQVNSYLPHWKALEKEDIDWGVIRVPENWEKKNGKKIELAFAWLRGKEQKSSPTVFIQGGPGGSSINGIGNWLNHPLREDGDIILVDLRGTGFSKPSLCPDLGNEILQILAKNQKPKADEEEKVKAALSCKDYLLEEGIDISSYNSFSIASDLNALKNALNIKTWNVYGVSYGTYTAQVYSALFSEDIERLLLDSPISNISDYVDLNTSNYINSLNLLFKECKKSNECNSIFPNLEDIYYETIQKLKEEPITVDVDKSIISTGKFTYNSEDFKIAIHQSLYQKSLVEILPALIYEFNNGNKDALSNLVAAFSGALGLDYGTYYCTMCSETINKNSLGEYQEDANKEMRLMGGVSFYKSDFEVCRKWGTALSMKFDSILSNHHEQTKIPVLLLSGDFDPITPGRNAQEIARSLDNAIHINIPLQGHAAAFSDEGRKITKDFISGKAVDFDERSSSNPISFVTDTYLHGGIGKFAGSLGKFDLIELAPFFIALLTILFTTVGFLPSTWKGTRRKKIFFSLYVFGGMLSVGFIGLLIYSIQKTATTNFYVLALGVPEKYSFIFYFSYISLFLFFIITLLYIYGYKNIKNKILIFTGLLSFLIYHLYIFNWQLVF